MPLSRLAPDNRGMTVPFTCRQRPFRPFTRLAAAALLCGACHTAVSAAPLPANTLPPEVEALLARAKVPREALAAIVVDAAPGATGKSAPLLSQQAGVPMNPASVMKLVTTYAGLSCWARPIPGPRRCLSMAPWKAACSKAT